MCVYTRIESVKALAANVLYYHQYQYLLIDGASFADVDFADDFRRCKNFAERNQTYLEIGGAAQKTSIADMINILYFTLLSSILKPQNKENML